MSARGGCVAVGCHRHCEDAKDEDQSGRNGLGKTADHADQRLMTSPTPGRWRPSARAVADAGHQFKFDVGLGTEDAFGVAKCSVFHGPGGNASGVFGVGGEQGAPDLGGFHREEKGRAAAGTSQRLAMVRISISWRVAEGQGPLAGKVGAGVGATWTTA